MDARTIRIALAQHRQNQISWTVVTIEIFMIAAGFGMAHRSWWQFGGIVIGLFVMMSIPVLSTVFMLALSALWAVIAWGLSGGTGSILAQVAIAAVAFVVGFGFHLSARQHLQDLKG